MEFLNCNVSYSDVQNSLQQDDNRGGHPSGRHSRRSVQHSQLIALLSPNQNLQGKRILVTGASSGIGNAIAVACANAGAIVISTGRNRDALDSLTTSLDGDGHSYIVADLTDTTDRDRLVQAIPPVDGVVHAAGIGQTLPAKFTTEQDVDKVFDINFKAPVMLQTQLITNKKLQRELLLYLLPLLQQQNR